MNIPQLILDRTYPGVKAQKSLRGRSKDLFGKQYGRLTALVPTHERDPRGEIVWACICSCGRVKLVSTSDLTRGNVQSCGCLLEEFADDLTGRVFERLTVTRRTERRSGKNVVWHCQCECGGETYTTGRQLKSGHSRSCGCLQREIASTRGKDHPNWRGGPSKDRHLRLTAEYSEWREYVIRRDILCRVCGSTEQLIAHHIKPFSNFPSLRVNPGNGIALCAKCHIAIHRRCGRNHDTADELGAMMMEQSLEREEC